MGGVQLLTDRTLNTLFPERCLCCGQLGQEIWCHECRSDLRPLSDREPGILMGQTEVRVMYAYQGSLRKALIQLKFGGYRRLAIPLGELLAPAIKDAARGFCAIVAPVPSDPVRKWRRGFNQVDLVLEAALQGQNLAYDPDLLRRERGGMAQVGLDRSQRKRNIVGKFYVADPTAVIGRNVILVDDILTTGATLLEAADTLLRCGAGKIRSVALAQD